MRAAAIVLMLLAIPMAAQGQADGAGGDPRFLTLHYAAGEIYRLPTSPSTVQTVLFAPGEIVRSVILSDPKAYTVIVSGAGDGLTLRPNGAAAPTMMTLRTELRAYDVELTAGDAEEAPSVVRFSYGQQARPAAPAADDGPRTAAAVYRLSGSDALRPASITDDGMKTYLSWQRDQAMPAVFAVGASGKEEMVDGYMREGRFTIDRVYGRLVFRIDRQHAAARRVNKRERDGRD